MTTRGGADVLLLDLVGFEGRARAALELAIEKHAKGRCVLAHSHAATAVLVDLDRSGAQKSWDAYCQRYPGRLAIFTSLHEGKRPPESLFLKKPISIDEFLKLVGRMTGRASRPATRSEAWVRQSLAASMAKHPEPVAPTAAPPQEADSARTTVEGRSLGPLSAHYLSAASSGAVPNHARVDLPVSQKSEASSVPATRVTDLVPAGEKLIDMLPDIDCDEPRAVAARTYTGPCTLLDALRMASAEVEATRHAHRVKIGETDWITFSANGFLVWTNIEEERFDALFDESCRTTASVVVCRPYEQKMARSAARWSTDPEVILWRAASATYHGKLPPGTNPKARVQLSRWPNLTRVLEIPHAVRIAALWTEQRLALDFTAEILGIAQRYVFTFYGAAHAAGLAGPVQGVEAVEKGEAVPGTRTNPASQVEVTGVMVERRHPETAIRAPFEATTRRGLIAKILGRLRGLGV
jgi:hypothetical protein